MACHLGTLATAPTKAIAANVAPQTGAIDDVFRAVSKTEDPEAQAEGKKIIEQLGALKYEVEHDRKLTYETVPFPSSYVRTRQANSLIQPRC